MGGDARGNRMGERASRIVPCEILCEVSILRQLPDSDAFCGSYCIQIDTPIATPNYIRNVAIVGVSIDYRT